jgi:TonB family protein
MMSTSVAGRYPVRARVGSPSRRQRPAIQPIHRTSHLPLAALVVSVMCHVLCALALGGLIVWNGWHRPSKVYVVNLAPAIAAVGNPRAPAPAPSMPAAPAPPAPSRAPTPTPTHEPRERIVREAPKLPEPSLPKPALPSRPALVRPGEKELPPLASTSTPRVERPQRVEKPEPVEKTVESRPAPPAPQGLPTGSTTGVGALSLDASDFPYAWYLRQVLQKVQGEWQRQNQFNEPNQRPLVLVEIQRDGSIRLPKIEQSSGNSLYDQAALRAVVDASPFPPLPQDWSRPSLRVMFRFDLEPRRG